MRATAQAVPFVETYCPDVFAHRIARVDLLSDGMARLWWVVEENVAEGVQYVLVGRILVPIKGIIENRELIVQALTDKAALPIEGLAAVH
jgi:hypothetical protein